MQKSDLCYQDFRARLPNNAYHELLLFLARSKQQTTPSIIKHKPHFMVLVEFILALAAQNIAKMFLKKC